MQDMRIRFTVPISATMLALASACVHPRTRSTADNLTRFAERVDSLRQANRIPGLSLVVLRDTTVVLAKGFGLANVENQVSVTPDTPFDIASVSKPISAVVAMRLVQDGRLNLDTPMRRFAGFTEFCDATRAEGGIFFGDFACTTDALTLRYVLSMTANGTAGARFLYNPPSYSWASRPMAEVAGRPFSDLVQDYVFGPAGMTHSARKHRRLPLPPTLASQLAHPYHIDSVGRVKRSDPPPPQGDGAAGGVVASAMDLARFDIALMTDKLITPASRDAMWTSRNGVDGRELPYGLGWFLGEYHGARVVWHTGLWEGQYSALYLKVLSKVPSERVTLILLANSDGLRWEQSVQEAEIGRSGFARGFLEMIAGR